MAGQWKPILWLKWEKNSIFLCNATLVKKIQFVFKIPVAPFVSGEEIIPVLSGEALHMAELVESL